MGVERAGRASAVETVVCTRVCTPSQAPGTKNPPESHLLLLSHGAQAGLVFCLNGPKVLLLRTAQGPGAWGPGAWVVPATLKRCVR